MFLTFSNFLSLILPPANIPSKLRILVEKHKKRCLKKIKQDFRLANCKYILYLFLVTTLWVSIYKFSDVCYVCVTRGMSIRMALDTNVWIHHKSVTAGRFIGWSVGWSVGWLLFGLLVGQSVGWLVGWLVNRLVVWLVGWLIGWLVGWLVSRSVGWSVGWLVGWLLVGLLVGRSIGWLVGWLSGWLFGRSVGWLAGWSIGGETVGWLVGFRSVNTCWII